MDFQIVRVESLFWLGRVDLKSGLSADSRTSSPTLWDSFPSAFSQWDRQTLPSQRSLSLPCLLGACAVPADHCKINGLRRGLVESGLDGLAGSNGLPDKLRNLCLSQHRFQTRASGTLTTSADLRSIDFTAVWAVWACPPTVIAGGDSMGRCLSIRLSWGGHSFDCCVAYLHNDSASQRAMITSVLAALQASQHPVVLGGDFNFVEDIPLDRMSLATGGNQQHPDIGVSACWQATLPRLRDTFRMRHPGVRRYTFVSRSSASRIDRIYVSPELSDKMVGSGVFCLRPLGQEGPQHIGEGLCCQWIWTVCSLISCRFLWSSPTSGACNHSTPHSTFGGRRCCPWPTPDISRGGLSVTAREA